MRSFENRSLLAVLYRLTAGELSSAMMETPADMLRAAAAAAILALVLHVAFMVTTSP